MAELIITEEEKATKTFLEWDNETIGKAVKKIACIFGDKDGSHGIKYTAACIFLIAESIKYNSYLTEIKLTECKDGDDFLGDWKITLERIDCD